VDDLHLVDVSPRGATRSLRDSLSQRAKQGYERRLDGPVVQALFARVPILVEGPSDRAALSVFWDALAAEGHVSPRHALALDFINCEGARMLPEMARLLREAGKPVVAWVELDVPGTLKRLREESLCAALVLYPDDPDRHNLEAALSATCSLPALAAGMQLIADTRGYPWEQQRTDLFSRCVQAGPQERELMKAAGNVADLLAILPEHTARTLVRAALAPSGVGPFEMKGARPARLMAETIVAADGVPEPFARAIMHLNAWVALDCVPTATEIRMMNDDRTA